MQPDHHKGKKAHQEQKSVICSEKSFDFIDQIVLFLKVIVFYLILLTTPLIETLKEWAGLQTTDHLWLGSDSLPLFEIRHESGRDSNRTVNGYIHY